MRGLSLDRATVASYVRLFFRPAGSHGRNSLEVCKKFCAAFAAMSANILLFRAHDQLTTQPMQIHVNTDRNIEGSARMTAYFTDTLHGALDRFQDQITRVDVHLSDENAEKEGSDDKRCLLEARLKGLKPVVVSHYAEN